MGKFENLFVQENSESGITAPLHPGLADHSAAGHSRARIIIADDHLIVAEALARICSTDFDVVAIARHGEELANMARRLPADLVLSEISLAGHSALAVLKRIRHERPHIRFMFLSAQEQPLLVSTALKAGAGGYILKKESSAELIAALRVVAAGGTYLPASLAAQCFRTEGLAAEVLTGRQRQILRLLVEGTPVRNIAQALGLSARTVETHKHAMMKRLEVRSVTGLVHHAKTLGLLHDRSVSVLP
jgi:DNA-binding NarL/FixJ family response regulator